MMTSDPFALLMSGAALAISIGGFIWNVWQKFIYVKPRLKISVAVMQTFGGGPNIDLIVLNVTNMGPGPAILHACIGGKYSISDRLRRSHAAGFLNPIDGNPAILPHRSKGPFSDGLPYKIDIAEVKSFYFPFQKETFLSQSLTDIGVVDTFGRSIWAPRKQVRKAIAKYKAAFPP